MKLEYARETADRSRAERAYWEQQISQLQPHSFRLGDNLTVNVTFQLLLTMIDGKVQTAVTGTSSTSVCTVRKATPSQFNKMEEVRRRLVSQPALLLGLSTMHAWIRFFEFVIHLSYKIDEGVKKWSNLSTHQKELVKAKKQRVQHMF